MQAGAIRAAAANFRQCLEEHLAAGAAPRRAARGVRPAAGGRHAGPADHGPDGLAARVHQVDLGLSRHPGHRRAHRRRPRDPREARATFDAMEKAYGVDRHIIAAIWGVESNYGTPIGERSVIRSTATLACIGRRQDYFREEFLAALEILARGDVRAGATQGLVGGRVRADAIHADVVQALRRRFRRRRPARRGRVGARSRRLDGEQPQEATAGVAARPGATRWWCRAASISCSPTARSMMTMREWERPASAAPAASRSRAPSDRAFLLVPAGAQGPGFLMLQNFRAIMKYNPSEAYALAIGHLADRLRGGEPFVQAWPRHERVLTRGGAARTAAASGAPRLRRRRARRPVRPAGPATRLRAVPGGGRARAGRLRHRRRSWSGCAAANAWSKSRQRPATPKIPVNSGIRGNQPAHLPIDIFVVVLADDACASS